MSNVTATWFTISIKSKSKFLYILSWAPHSLAPCFSLLHHLFMYPILRPQQISHYSLKLMSFHAPCFACLEDLFTSVTYTDGHTHSLSPKTWFYSLHLCEPYQQLPSVDAFIVHCWDHNRIYSDVLWSSVHCCLTKLKAPGGEKPCWLLYALVGSKIPRRWRQKILNEFLI